MRHHFVCLSDISLHQIQPIRLSANSNIRQAYRLRSVWTFRALESLKSGRCVRKVFQNDLLEHLQPFRVAQRKRETKRFAYFEWKFPQRAPIKLQAKIEFLTFSVNTFNNPKGSWTRNLFHFYPRNCLCLHSFVFLLSQSGVSLLFDILSNAL